MWQSCSEWEESSGSNSYRDGDTNYQICECLQLQYYNTGEYSPWCHQHLWHCDILGDFYNCHTHLLSIKCIRKTSYCEALSLAFICARSVPLFCMSFAFDPYFDYFTVGIKGFILEKNQPQSQFFVQFCVFSPQNNPL